MMAWTREALAQRDAADPLAPLRTRFRLPEQVIYLDGNSLGALPADTPQRLAQVVTDEWGTGLIRSWNDAGWVDLATRVGDKIGCLIGAPPGSVLAADSTSVNLFKVLGAALALRPGRRVIVTEAGNFPTDLYIAGGLAALLDRGHRMQTVPTARLVETIDADTAVLMLTHVDYRSGRMHDMARLTNAAHAAGALAIWDLAHSAGAVPLDLAAARADFAVGCGYKFLNGGPGAPAFLHVAPRWQAQANFPLRGWFGHADPFAFEAAFRPAQGMQAAAVGTPPILGLSALEVGVDLALAAPMDVVRSKSLALSDLFIDLLAQFDLADQLRLVSPVAHAERGSQLSLAHPDASAIMQALISRGVIGDFRTPDVLRFGITPLYLRHVDLWDALLILADIMRSGAWQREIARNPASSPAAAPLRLT